MGGNGHKKKCFPASDLHKVGISSCLPSGSMSHRGNNPETMADVLTAQTAVRRCPRGFEEEMSGFLGDPPNV